MDKLEWQLVVVVVGLAILWRPLKLGPQHTIKGLKDLKLEKDPRERAFIRSQMMYTITIYVSLIMLILMVILENLS